jgi:hypothetical protein
MHRNSSDRPTPLLRSAWRAFASLFIALAMAAHAIAQAPASTADAPPQMSAEDLDKLVGRIALYPDDLVAIILPASTEPLQIVQADRFLDRRKSDPKLPIDEKWDDSVKALVNYPDVVKMMSGDLDWTAALGEAVVADQAGVMEAIQAFRRRTQAAGNLKSNDKQVVEVEKEVIKIVPANPEVIYVPQYNPTTVVYAGAPAWGYYPTPYPVYYYPYAPGAAFATGLIWGAAIGAAWGGARWGTNWGGGDININRNTNINTGDINRGNINRGNAGQLPAKPVGRRGRRHRVEVQQATGASERHRRARQHHRPSRRCQCRKSRRHERWFRWRELRFAVHTFDRFGRWWRRRQSPVFRLNGERRRVRGGQPSRVRERIAARQLRRLARRRAGWRIQRVRLRSPDEHGQLARRVQPQLDGGGGGGGRSMSGGGGGGRGGGGGGRGGGGRR